MRTLVEEDLPEMLRLEEEAYIAELVETRRGFLSKIQLFPRGCICCEEAGHIHAFAISHPWQAGHEVQIDAWDMKLPDSPDCYYIHDIVVERNYQGTGLAGMLVAQLLKVARGMGLSTVHLVAVQGSEGFWAHFGFEPVRQLTYRPDAPAIFMRYAAGEVSTDLKSHRED